MKKQENKIARQETSWKKYNSALNMTPEDFLIKFSYIPEAELVWMLGRHGIHASYYGVQHKKRSLGMSCAAKVVQESPFVRYDAPWTVTGNQLYVADTEFPYHNADFLNRVIELADTWKIKEINFAGDMVLLDCLSPFGRNWKATQQKEKKNNTVSLEHLEKLQALRDGMKNEKDKTTLTDYINSLNIDWKESDGDISEEWELAGANLRSMMDVFTHARTIQGNHEGRLLMALKSPLNPHVLLDVLRVNNDGKAWMEISPYYYMLHQHERGMLRISHPKNFGQPAGPAAVMADKYQMDFAMGHSHRWGMIQSRSSKYVGIDIGCCVDRMRPAYHAQRDSTAWEWTAGALLVRDGYYYLLHPTQTNWERMKKS